MTRPLAAGAPAGYVAEAGAYRFFIAATQVGAVHEAGAISALPHAPPWLAGMAVLGGQLVGVIDWGRFLGVARLAPGPVVLPNPGLGQGWALQVAALEVIEAGCGVVVEADPGPEPAGDAAPPEWARRPRPPFSAGRARWTDAQGMRHADLLDLAVLLAHPRLTELA